MGARPFTGRVASPASAEDDGSELGAAGAGELAAGGDELAVGGDELAVGGDELAVGGDELAVGAGRGPVVVTDGGGDGADVRSAVVVLPVPSPPPAIPATMMKTRASPVQLATCAPRGSDRKRRHQPGPCLPLLTGVPVPPRVLAAPNG